MDEPPFREKLQDPSNFDFDFEEWKTPALNDITKCRDTGSYFFQEKAKTEKDPRRANSYQFLSIVTSLILEPAKFPKSPLQPPGNPDRSCKPADLARELAAQLVASCEDIEFSALRARLLDFCYLKLGKARIGAIRAAVASYLSAVEEHNEPNWAVKALQRALQLSLQFKLSQELEAAKDTIYRRLHGSDEAFENLNHRIVLLEGLFDVGWEPLPELLQLVEIELQNDEAFSHHKEKLLLLRKRIEQKPQSLAEPEAAKKTLLELAGIKTEEALKQSSPMLITHRMKAALGYAKEAGDKEFEEACVQALGKIQPRIVQEEMTEFSGEIDVENLHQKAEEFVIQPARSWLDAHARIAIYLFSNLPIPERMEELAAASAAKNVFDFLATKWTLNADGETIGFAEGGSLDPIVRRDTLRQLSRLSLRLAWIQYRLLGKLGPLKRVHIEELVALVTTKAFPHQQSLARGLYRGWGGDWMVSMALLIPALENTIRLELQNAGAVPFRVKKEEIQEKYLLHHLTGQFSDRFDPRYLYSLKAVLLKDGFNLRNLLSHGLIPDQSFPWQPSILAWGLFVIFLFHPGRSNLLKAKCIKATEE